MNNRSNPTESTFFRYVTPLGLGTIANICSTVITLPLRYIVAQRQNFPEKSLSTLLTYTLSREGMAEVWSQSRTAIQMAPKQSLAYLGVTATAFDVFREDTPLVRGLKAGLFSGMAESLVTAKDMQKMVAGWSHVGSLNVDKKTVFLRSLQATTIKNFFANPTTLIIYAYSHDCLKSQSSSDSPAWAAFAGMTSALAASPFIAPFAKLEASVQKDPSKTVWEKTKALAKLSPREIWSGGASRGVFKAVDGMIKFGLIGAGQQMIEKYRHIDHEESMDSHDLVVGESHIQFFSPF